MTQLQRLQCTYLTFASTLTLHTSVQSVLRQHSIDIQRTGTRCGDVVHQCECIIATGEVTLHFGWTHDDRSLHSLHKHRSFQIDDVLAHKKLSPTLPVQRYTVALFAMALLFQQKKAFRPRKRRNLMHIPFVSFILILRRGSHRRRKTLLGRGC